MILFIIGALFALIALAVLIFSDDAKRAAIIPAVVAVIFIGIWQRMILKRLSAGGLES